MCPRSQTSGLMNAATGSCSAGSSKPSTSARVRRRTSSSVPARPRTAGVEEACPEIARILCDAVAEEEEPVPFERPHELEGGGVGQQLALGDAGLRAAAGEPGGEREEQLVDDALGEQGVEHPRPALAEDGGDAVPAARDRERRGEGRLVHPLDLPGRRDVRRRRDLRAAHDEHGLRRVAEERRLPRHAARAGDLDQPGIGGEPVGLALRPALGLPRQAVVGLGGDGAGTGEHGVDLGPQAVEHLAVAVGAEGRRLAAVGGAAVRGHDEVRDDPRPVLARASAEGESGELIGPVDLRRIGEESPEPHARIVGGRTPVRCRREMKLSRVHLEEVVAIIGGLLLAGGLFLAWYTLAGPNGQIGPSRFPDREVTGWEALTIMRYLLLAAAAAPIILAYIVVRGHALSWPRGEVTAVVAITALTMVVTRGFIVRPGQPPGSIGVGIGFWVSLVGGLIMFIAAARHRAASDDAGKKPPGVL